MISVGTHHRPQIGRDRGRVRERGRRRFAAVAVAVEAVLAGHQMLGHLLLEQRVGRVHQPGLAALGLDRVADRGESAAASLALGHQQQRGRRGQQQRVEQHQRGRPLAVLACVFDRDACTQAVPDDGHLIDPGGVEHVVEVGHVLGRRLQVPTTASGRARAGRGRSHGGWARASARAARSGARGHRWCARTPPPEGRQLPTSAPETVSPAAIVTRCHDCAPRPSPKRGTGGGEGDSVARCRSDSAEVLVALEGHRDHGVAGRLARPSRRSCRPRTSRRSRSARSARTSAATRPSAGRRCSGTARPGSPGKIATIEANTAQDGGQDGAHPHAGHATGDTVRTVDVGM